MGCLYKIKSPSGKSYIGISMKTAEARWRQHRYNAAKGRGHRQGEECAALYDAMRAYGSQNFTLEILAEAESWDELCKMECSAIVFYKTLAPQGYNLTKGGEGSIGAVATDVMRKKMSEAQQRRWLDPKHRVVMLEVLRANRPIAAYRRRNLTEAERAAHGNAVRAGYAKPGGRERAVQAARERAARPGWGAMLSASMRGLKRPKWSNERKALVAALRRSEWANPAMRAKRLAGFARSREIKRGA